MFDLTDLTTPSVLTQIKVVEDSLGKVQFKAVYGNEDFVKILENGTIVLVKNPTQGRTKAIKMQFILQHFSQIIYFPPNIMILDIFLKDL